MSELVSVSSVPARVRVPSVLLRERLLLGELHLVRGRLDGVLAELARVIEASEQDAAWLRVEEAARLSRRALVAAVAAAPPLPSVMPRPGELTVGRLRVDTATGRQWYAETEFELTPLHHRLLTVMAADPHRVFGKDELLCEVWRRTGETNAVKMSVSRLRRALETAGAPDGSFLLSLHGVGWALTRTE